MTEARKQTFQEWGEQTGFQGDFADKARAYNEYVKDFNRRQGMKALAEEEQYKKEKLKYGGEKVLTIKEWKGKTGFEGNLSERIKAYKKYVNDFYGISYKEVKYPTTPYYSSYGEWKEKEGLSGVDYDVLIRRYAAYRKSRPLKKKAEPPKKIKTELPLVKEKKRETEPLPIEKVEKRKFKEVFPFEKFAKGKTKYPSIEEFEKRMKMPFGEEPKVPPSRPPVRSITQGEKNFQERIRLSVASFGWWRIGKDDWGDEDKLRKLYAFYRRRRQRERDRWMGPAKVKQWKKEKLKAKELYKSIGMSPELKKKIIYLYRKYKTSDILSYASDEYGIPKKEIEEILHDYDPRYVREYLLMEK